MSGASGGNPDRSGMTEHEVRLAAAAERYRMLYELESDAVFLIDNTSGEVLEANAAAASMYGYAVDELRTMRNTDLSAEPAETGRITRSTPLDPSRIVHVPLRFHRKRDGTVFPVEITGRFFDDHGRSVQLIAVRDITSRWHAERALQESEERFRTILEHAPDGILVQVDGVIAYVNAAATAIFGAKAPDELLRTPILDRVHPDYRDRVRERMQLINVERIAAPPVEEVFLRVDGSPVPVEASAAPVTYLGKPAALAFIRDVTRRKRIEAELAQVQRLDSIGRIAGGIAHDFNNMLNVIGGYTELALARLGSDDPLQAQLLEVKHAAERAAELTRQLLTFSRRQANEPKLLDVNQQIRASERMMTRLLGEAITLHVDLYAGPAAVRIDPGQLDQILVNLLANARDALDGAGTVRIETGIVSIDETMPARLNACPPGAYVTLAVTDNGRGMDTVTLEHVFEPFFTTREDGGASGLGLAVVYGIVRQHQGYIDVSSAPARGSTFRVFLPRQDLAVLPSRREGPAAGGVRGGQEIVLVVEDEEQVRRLVVAALERSGYTVLQAGSPDEALDIAANREETIDLLVTDVIMPGMDGAELHRRLIQMRPTIRTLFMSGYTSNIMGEHGILEDGVYFIQKPFSVRDLTKKVRELLD